MIGEFLRRNSLSSKANRGESTHFLDNNLRPRSHENGTERNGPERNGTERNFLRGVHTAMDRFEVLISSSLEI